LRHTGEITDKHLLEAVMGSFGAWHGVILLFWFALVIVPLWRIVRKAGYPGGLSLLALIPLVNLVCLWMFAFTQWPAERGRG
jgi:hypothetical protein